MSAAVEYRPRVDEEEKRESFLSIRDGRLGARRKNRLDFVYLTTVNFTPVVAIQRNAMIQVFPISKLSQADKEVINIHTRETSRMNVFQQTAYQ